MEINPGQKIKSLRKQKNISQEMLAKALGVPLQTVSKWESGAVLPDVAMLPVIAGFFEVSPDELLDFTLLEPEYKAMKIRTEIGEMRRRARQCAMPHGSSRMI